MLEWFYLGYLGQEVLGELPPVIGVIRIDLLGLYKFVDAMGGYMNVTFNDKWYQVAKFLGLTYEHHEIVNEVYKEYIGMVKVYNEEAKRSRHGEPRDVAVNCRGTAGRERPQVSAKINAEVEEMLDETPRKRSRTEREDTCASNDFTVVSKPNVQNLEKAINSKGKDTKEYVGNGRVSVEDVLFQTKTTPEQLPTYMVLQKDDGQAIKECYKEYIGAISVEIVGTPEDGTPRKTARDDVKMEGNKDEKNTERVTGFCGRGPGIRDKRKQQRERLVVWNKTENNKGVLGHGEGNLNMILLLALRNNQELS
nr:bulb-type lectin domain-containing protein [Tanacetum cinerariifolium]